jgi:hypothetical protein
MPSKTAALALAGEMLPRLREGWRRRERPEAGSEVSALSAGAAGKAGKPVGALELLSQRALRHRLNAPQLLAKTRGAQQIDDD